MSSSTNGQWYPPEWPERIRALAAGELTPVTPRLAATVMLLRDGGEAGAGPEVHMLRRRTSMAFAGGAYAYPGGGVDPRDEHWGAGGGRGDGGGSRPDDGWAGPSRKEWADRFGTDEATAQAIVCAAVRETFEEAGVLLAGPGAASVVDDTTGEDWERDRAALAAHELSFADFLDRRGLVLRSDLLGAWAHWITPEFEKRRYDTWFFVAALPEGQRTRNASTEADRTVWTRPGEAAAGYDSGELLMMPPTIAMLRQLAPYRTAAEVLAASTERDLTAVLAEARLEDGQVVLSWPGHDEFTKRVLTNGGDGADVTDGVNATDGADEGDGGTGGGTRGSGGRTGGAPGGSPA
ncbi:NUDIX hydrolase [Streptomyces sp. HNM0575]|uniref:NUDIX hydrolase n=1 Tax=Streptomyces sp. HNM0575 TaxID=2716338 RepID=UPI001F0DBB0D|nr:NUDIX hydrolase [Streptomyces sp. HNM0575]